MKKQRPLKKALAAVVALASLIAAPAMAATPAGTSIPASVDFYYSDANNNTFTASASVTMTVTSVASVSIACEANKSVPSGTAAVYACTVTNTGNEAGTFALTASSLPAWATSLIFDDNGDGVKDAGETTVTASTGALAAAGTYKFFAIASIPADTANSITAVTTINVTDGGTATASVARTTTVQAPKFTVTTTMRNVTTNGVFADSGVTGKPGEVMEVRVEVKNDGALEAVEVRAESILDANLTAVPNSVWIGSDGTAHNAGTNANKLDALGDDPDCGVVETCGTAFMDSGHYIFTVGKEATNDLFGGNGKLSPGTTVYIFFRATVK